MVWQTSSNLQTWLIADDLGLTNGATVAVNWNDHGPNGTAAVPSGGLIYNTNDINGHASISFNGSTGIFTISDRIGLRFTSRFYGALVVKTGAVNANHTFFAKGTTSATPDYVCQVAEGGTGTINFYDGSWRNSSVNAVAATTWYLLEFYFDGTKWYFFVNGVSTGSTGGAGIGTSANPLRIGTQGSDLVNNFDGRIAEIIMYGNGNADDTGRISYTDIRSIRNYLARKYALNSVVSDPYYSLFYNGTNASGTNYSIGAAISTDAKIWTKVPFPVLLTGTGETATVKDPHVLKVGSIYYLYYSGTSVDGSAFHISLATSTDGYLFTKSGSNPVLSAGAGWESSWVRFPFVIYDTQESNSTKRWKMWYSGSNGTTEQIGYAYSANGVTWTKSVSNPLILVGGVGTWDHLNVLLPSVVYVSGGTSYCFYSGNDLTTNPQDFKVGVATFTTPEGTYTKSGSNPLLSPNNAVQSLTSNTLNGTAIVKVTNTSLYHVGEPCLLKDNTSTQVDVYILSVDSSTQMTLTANVTRDWTTTNSTQIISYYAGSVSPKSVLPFGNGYVMYGAAFQQYSGAPFSERSFAATATTLGGPWTYDYTRGFVLPLGSTWDTLSAENPSVIRSGGYAGTGLLQ